MKNQGAAPLFFYFFQGLKINVKFPLTNVAAFVIINL